MPEQPLACGTEPACFLDASRHARRPVARHSDANSVATTTTGINHQADSPADESAAVSVIPAPTPTATRQSSPTMKSYQKHANARSRVMPVPRPARRDGRAACASLASQHRPPGSRGNGRSSAVRGCGLTAPRFEALSATCARGSHPAPAGASTTTATERGRSRRRRSISPRSSARRSRREPRQCDPPLSSARGGSGPSEGSPRSSAGPVGHCRKGRTAEALRMEPRTRIEAGAGTGCVLRRRRAPVDLAALASPECAR
jgi:hypothetical protein